MNFELRKQNAFINITSFLKYQESANAGLRELKEIIKKHDNLNNKEVRNWVIVYKNLYEKYLRHF